MDISAEIQKYRQEIKSERMDMSFGEIINMYRDKEIIISPEYQRAFRWDEQRQSDFIESILLGIPFPSIFVATNPDGKWELIDGLQRVSTVLSFFNEYYYKKITSNFLEIQYNCNFDYINRVFKETTGKTIFVYLNELRISQAKLLFNTGSFKVSEVSEKVGFQDSYYFCKVFKKYTGVTPSNYIKNINI